MILDRLSILRVLSPQRRAAAALAARWQRAADRDPELISDVIRMGGVLAKSPARFVDGVEQPDPIDPIRLARDQGRRELATELLALMSIGPQELNDLTREA